MTTVLVGVLTTFFCPNHPLEVVAVGVFTYLGEALTLGRGAVWTGAGFVKPSDFKVGFDCTAGLFRFSDGAVAFGAAGLLEKKLFPL